MAQGAQEDGMSSGERISWVLVAALCLFFGYRLGAQSASQGRSALTRSVAPPSGSSTALPSATGPVSPDGIWGGEEARAGVEEGLLGGAELEGDGSSMRVMGPLSDAERAQLCPPCDCPCATPKPKPVKSRVKRLPPPKMTPLERAKLLAWVKKHSERLRRCRDAGQPIYRLHSTLKLKADASGVHTVKLRGEEVPASALSCIQSEMLKWPPPAGLAPAQHPLLVFNLQLD